MAKRKKLISKDLQDKLVWIPCVNISVYFIWFYNMRVSGAKVSQFFFSWFCGGLASVPWWLFSSYLLDHSLKDSPYANIVEFLFSYIGLFFLGRVLIHFQDKYLNI